MLKSETEQVIRRCMEETNAQFTEEQVQFLAIVLNKICGRIVEEAIASSNSSRRGGSGPGFFAG